MYMSRALDTERVDGFRCEVQRYCTKLRLVGRKNHIEYEKNCIFMINRFHAKHPASGIYR